MTLWNNIFDTDKITVEMGRSSGSSRRKDAKKEDKIQQIISITDKDPKKPGIQA